MIAPKIPSEPSDDLAQGRPRGGVRGRERSHDPGGRRQLEFGDELVEAPVAARCLSGRAGRGVAADRRVAVRLREVAEGVSLDLPGLPPPLVRAVRDRGVPFARSGRPRRREAPPDRERPDVRTRPGPGRRRRPRWCPRRTAQRRRAPPRRRARSRRPRRRPAARARRRARPAARRCAAGSGPDSSCRRHGGGGPRDRWKRRSVHRPHRRPPAGPAPPRAAGARRSTAAPMFGSHRSVQPGARAARGRARASGPAPPKRSGPCRAASARPDPSRSRRRRSSAERLLDPGERIAQACARSPSSSSASRGGTSRAAGDGPRP